MRLARSQMDQLMIRVGAKFMNELRAVGRQAVQQIVKAATRHGS